MSDNKKPQRIMQSWLYSGQRNPACTFTELQTEMFDPADGWVCVWPASAAGNSDTPTTPASTYPGVLLRAA